MRKSFDIKVTLVVAARNEERYIAKCLDSLYSQTYDNDLIEINVVDGMSSDGTRRILDEYKKKHFNLNIFDNKKKTAPYAFNIGTKNAKGDLIFIMGGHNVYPKDYVKKCVSYMKKMPEIDNVGGVIATKTIKNDIISKAVSSVLSSRFGVGSAKFRTKIKKPQFVSTVFGGCYRRGVFQKTGYFNESLKRAQDIEFNLRLKRNGGKILLAPDIHSFYYPKTDLGGFARYNFEAGKWPVYVYRLTQNPLNLMHYIPVLFVLGLFFGPLVFFFSFFSFLQPVYLFFLALYLTLALFEAVRYAIKEKVAFLIVVMPFIFFIRHVFYGIGSFVAFFGHSGRLKD